MTFLSHFKKILWPWGKKSSVPSLNPELFIYIKIPNSIGPLERSEQYEEPIEEKLQQAALGTVSGGGSQLGDKQPDGTHSIEFCGLDVDVTNLEAALKLLRTELLLLNAPNGTELQYTKNGVRLQDELYAGKWTLGQSRINLHPAFNI